jgi:hypothetical protein
MPVLRSLLNKFTRKPRDGEKTGAQHDQDAFAGGLWHDTGLPAPEPGTYDLYRKMSSDPTAALAIAMSKSPIRAAGHQWEADDDVPEDRLDFIRDQIEPSWRWLVANALRSLEFGWQGFEIVPSFTDGSLGIAKIKPLLQDMTKIVVDKTTGAYLGLRQKGAELWPEETLLITYDWSPGNLYGRSRHENIRSGAWIENTNLTKKEATYTAMVASVIMILQYPEGKSKNKMGALVNNYQIALNLINDVAQGKPVCMPNTMAKWAADLATKGVDIAKLRPWLFDFVESKGGHASDFIAQRKHKESLIFRGWLVPERAATEGTHGTKAEAESHGSVALQIAEELHLDLVEAINLYLVNPLVVANYGEQARDTIRVKATPIVDEKRQLFLRLFEKAMSNPSILEWFVTTIEAEGELEGLGLSIQESAPGAGDESPLQTPTNTGDGNGESAPFEGNPRLQALWRGVTG